MTEILKQFAMPNSTFEDVLIQPLGFKIPVAAELADQDPDIFSVGFAEFEFSVECWMSHKLVGDSKTTVTSLNQSWLSIFQDLDDVTVYQNAHESSSDKTELGSDSTLMKQSMLVLKELAKTSATLLEVAREELLSNMNQDTFKCFPVGQSAVPGIVTSPTKVNLYAINCDPPTKSFSTSFIKSYDVQSTRGRIDFIVDIFKLLKWIHGLTEAVGVVHLVPGVRRQTSNGHFVTWCRAGLLKEFNKASLPRIPFELIGKIYGAALSNLERGTVNCKSILITSVGQTLRHAAALRPTIINRGEVLAQVRKALDNLHSIGLAHCDVSIDNIYVLDNNEIILGDFEYCREVDSAPPDVCRRWDSELGTPVTSLQLDEQQYSMLQDELASF